ncbi:G-protein-signaling modulator 2-like isoform X2 [Lampris incognitus]|uniref:G-protein-signaling modulator 2-like isoform X2 n=1 Tax=Lampris incognitus TaxID=2546036 RepID=UPI0024B4ADE2|nr:G-protein-signaling modulator 2-like isoform X2 [Lampris incognitus]
MESSCLELALEGERLCKTGDYKAGVSFFESAIQVGTEDLQILSAIYSQLGNAYFHLQEYGKALEYHRHDLTLTRTIGDELGEAKASGNLGNTLKLLGRFDEAVVCCQRHLDITRAMYDKVGQARALYNFGNVYHAKGKSICWIGAEPGEFPEDARIALKKATQYYEANLALAMDLGDRAAQGRTYGNLGNTYYLMGDFENAVAAHEKRLLVAKEFGDRSAERRAHCNLGNAHVFLGQFDLAASHYKRTLQIARLLKDRAVEAQACYSLGNTYTLLQDYERAIDYHLKHLIIAQELKDRVGEGRAFWSLGNAYTALGNHEQAIHFAEKHLEIARETGDKSGEVTARMNLSDLRLVVGLKSNPNIHLNSYSNTNTNRSALPESHQGCHTLPEAKCLPGRRDGEENLELLRPSPDKMSIDQMQTHSDWVEDALTKSSRNNTIKASTKLFLFHRLKSKKQKGSKSPNKGREERNERSAPESDTPPSAKPRSRDTLGEDSFFDLLSRFQGNRMDDQRCSLFDGQCLLPTPTSPSSTPPVVERKSPSSNTSSPHTMSLHKRLEASDDPTDDVFFDMLVKCQGSRLDDQRCAAPPSPTKGSTVPDEDFVSLILRSQANRMEEQRVLLPAGCTQSKPV